MRGPAQTWSMTFALICALRAILVNAISLSGLNGALASVLHHIEQESFPGTTPQSFYGENMTVGSSSFGPSSVLTSAFPVDLIISYNQSDGVTKQFLARYASFSPILNVKLRSKFVLLNLTACSPIDHHGFPDVKGKIVIVQRGECAFVDKVTNLLEAKLDPHAIIIANNEPHRGLVTMYSTSFNEDGLVTVPILFMTLEDYQGLVQVKDQDISLVIQTASIDGLVGVMLLMAISPTLIIFLCYLLVKALRHFRKRTLNARYKKIVLKLPVFMFSTTHLIPANNFYPYLLATRQTEDLPLTVNSSDDLSSQIELRPLPAFVINGTDVRTLTDMDLLFAEKDYFKTQKCSICLGRFVPLSSKVLVLKCKHMYHEECLSNWLVNFRRSCPLCNENLNLLEQSHASSNQSRTYRTFTPDLERGDSDSAFLLSSSPSSGLLLRSEEYGSNNLEPMLPQGLFDDVTTTSSLKIPIESTSKSSLQQTHFNELAVADSVESSTSYMTTRTQLLESISSSFFTPQSTREDSVEDAETDLFQLSTSTIRLP